MYFDCTFAGFGGQGIMLMGNILAHAAMEEKRKVTYMPVYGVEMRGGTANCTVIISDNTIGSPITRQFMSAIVMNRPSLEKFGTRVRKNGILVVNTSLIPEKDVPCNDVQCLMVPGRELAIGIGNDKLANMIILGAAVYKFGVIQLASVKKALYSALDKRYHHMININTAALERGAQFADQGR
jgi:2-oxoglutarate ferredoxin oxidoreductase subunit gamma